MVSVQNCKICQGELKNEAGRTFCTECESPTATINGLDDETEQNSNNVDEGDDPPVPPEEQTPRVSFGEYQALVDRICQLEHEISEARVHPTRAVADLGGELDDDGSKSTVEQRQKAELTTDIITSTRRRRGFFYGTGLNIQRVKRIMMACFVGALFVVGLVVLWSWPQGKESPLNRDIQGVVERLAKTEGAMQEKLSSIDNALVEGVRWRAKVDEKLKDMLNIVLDVNHWRANSQERLQTIDSALFELKSWNLNAQEKLNRIDGTLLDVVNWKILTREKSKGVDTDLAHVKNAVAISQERLNTVFNLVQDMKNENAGIQQRLKGIEKGWKAVLGALVNLPNQVLPEEVYRLAAGIKEGKSEVAGTRRTSTKLEVVWRGFFHYLKIVLGVVRAGLVELGKLIWKRMNGH